MRQFHRVLLLPIVGLAIASGCDGDSDGGGSGSKQAFCEKFAELQDQGEDLEDLEYAEEDGDEAVERAIDNLRELEDSAPPELAGDLAEVREYLEDPQGSPPESVRDAGQRRDQFVEDECGLDAD